MFFAKLATAIVLAVVVPFALVTVWVLLLNHSAIQAILRPIARLGDLVGLLGYLAITGLGFSFIVRVARWKDLELPERQLLVGTGLLYFPVMLYLMFYWSFWVVGAAYGSSL